MTVLVTGASGHLGANLVRALLDRGRAVRALEFSDSRGLDGLDIDRVRGDVCDPDSLAPAMDGCEVLYHFAAQISIAGGLNGRVRAVNVDGVRNVMNAALAAGVKRVVHCSSIHAFDLHPTERPIDETTDRAQPGVQGAYDCSKADGEAEVRSAIERGLDAVIINPTGVIGPHDYKPSRMGHVFIKLFQRRMPALVRGGFDFVDVRDVIAGAMAAEQRGRTGHNYILSGRWYEVRDIADAAHAVTGVAPPRFSSPMVLARIGAPFATWFSKLTRSEPLFTSESLAALRANRAISHDKATQELDYRPRPLADSASAIYECFFKRGVLTRLDQ